MIDKREQAERNRLIFWMLMAFALGFFGRQRKASPSE
jgi:hypothetical protein